MHISLLCRYHCLASALLRAYRYVVLGSRGAAMHFLSMALSLLLCAAFGMADLASLPAVSPPFVPLGDAFSSLPPALPLYFLSSGMSQLVLDLQVCGSPIVVDLPAETSIGFLDLAENVKVLSFQSIWEGSAKISKTQSHRKAFYTKISVKFPFSDVETDIPFRHIGSGANRIC